MYSAPTSKGRPTPITAPPNEILPGYDRFRKTIDFGNAATNCFDFEEALAFLCSPVVKDTKGRKGLVASPVYIVDPCQSGQSPLKIQTILTTNAARNTSDIVNNTGVAGVYLATENITESGFTVSANLGYYNFQGTSAANTAQVNVFQIKQLAQILAINMVATGGTATLVVEVASDFAPTTWIQIDSIAAALSTNLQYTLATNALNGAAQAGTVAGTGAGTVKLNPLAFTRIRITAGAAGAGFTTTLIVAIK